MEVSFPRGGPRVTSECRDLIARLLVKVGLCMLRDRMERVEGARGGRERETEGAAGSCWREALGRCEQAN